MNIAHPFGIDLGTTRTAAAVFLPDADAPVVARDDQRRATIPSVVRSRGDSRWLTGYAATEPSEPTDAPLVESVKRRIGTAEPIADADDLLAEDISGIILSSIADQMRSYLAESKPRFDFEVRDAVITVPAYFDAPQIEATRRAGEAAGLQVAGLLQEPTAAAIYHTWRLELGDGTFLVYDLGGGTFDVSVIRSVFGEYQVLSIDGDNHLGGDDFDRRLADLLLSRVVESGGSVLDTSEESEAFRAMLPIARRTKEQLSDRQRVRIDEPELFADAEDNPVHVDTAVTRENFESAVADLLESTILATNRAVETAVQRHDLEPTDVDGIFMVGGSTRVPAVRRRLKESVAGELEIPSERIVGDKPETSVALGAALHSSAIAPCRYERDRFCIAISDFPSDNPDRHLIGRVEHGTAEVPAEIAFGTGDSTQKTAVLQGDESPYRFSVSGFDAETLSPTGEPTVACELLDDDGGPLVDPFELWIPNRPDGAIPAPTLALSNPAVLAKDINVEVVDDGEPTRHTLIEQGTHLPTTAHRKLAVGDDSGAVVFRLFQHRLPIHTIAVELPDDTPPGTPVELTVDVDQGMNLTARGTAGNQSFEARIQRPAAPRHRSWDEIEDLLDRADDIAAELWGMEARRFSRQSKNIRAGIRAAARHDSRRLQVLARRLEDLVADYAPRPNRTPGRSRIDAMLDAIRRIVFAADEDLLGRSHHEWSQKLDELAVDVQTAWRGDDDAKWQAVADRVQATYESVAQDEFRFRRRDPERYARTLLDSTSARLHSVSRSLRNFPYSTDERARRLQQSEIERITDSLESLERRLPSSPDSDEISTLKSLAESVGHLERRLERVHTLGVPRKGES